MSTKADQKTAVAMTKSYDGKPTAVPVAERAGAVVRIGDPAKTGVIGFPASAVYAFEEALYRKLEAAYRDGKEAVIRSLWQQAKPF